MFVGEPKRLSHLIPDPFLLQIPNILILGIICFCDCGGQRVIEAEQPAFMQGIWEVISLLPDPQYRHLGICIRFGAFPGVLGGRWERFGGFRWLPWKTHEAPGKLLGRYRTLWDARGRSRRRPGRSGTTGEGSNTTPVMVWRLPPRPTTPRQPDSNCPARAHRTYKFNKIIILISLQGL